MQVKVLVDEIREDSVVILVGDDTEAVVWPKNEFPSGIEVGDLLNFEIKIELLAEDTRKMAPQNLLQILAKK